MSVTITDFPVRENIVEGTGRYPWLIRDRWRIWLRNLGTLISALIGLTGPDINLTGQAASIGTTSMVGTTLAPGLYRGTWYARITTADAVSSSLTVTFSWTESSVGLTHAFTALTGNTTTTTGSGTYLMKVDQATPISYSTTYVSNTPGSMQYTLSLTLETIAT